MSLSEGETIGPLMWRKQNRDYTALHKNSRNPTHGSGWILQILFRKEFEKSTNYRWWDSKASVCISFRKHLKYPPTAVGGISDFLCKANFHFNLPAFPI